VAALAQQDAFQQLQAPLPPAVHQPVARRGGPVVSQAAKELALPAESQAAQVPWDARARVPSLSSTLVAVPRAPAPGAPTAMEHRAA